MKWIKNLMMGVIVPAMVGACLKQPEYSVIPQITLKDFYFKAHTSSNPFDTLVIKFDFKDGDGDLGIGSTDSTNLDSYNPWFYYYDVSTYEIQPYIYLENVPNGYARVNYAARNIPQISSKISFPPINCISWQTIVDANHINGYDTVYITQNENAYNIVIRLYEKQNGSYVEFDPATDASYAFPNCQPNILKGAFKDLSDDRGRNAPLEGTFTYRYPSATWNLSFSGKDLRLKLFIRDRAQHVSDTITRSDFTLASITRP